MTSNQFTMSQLLREVNRTFVELSNNGGTRIFEGLSRIGDGVYRISTGS